MSERAHHPYSPSTLNCREACPKYSPTHEESEASLMGTLQHAAVETGLDDDRIPDYRALAVAQCQEFAAQRIAAFPGGTVLREEYLAVDDEIVTAPDGTKWTGTSGGYPDLAIISADETEAEIDDWKFGKNVVAHAKENVQGICYLLGLKRKFPKLKKGTVRFIQPHIDHESSHTFDISDPSELLLRVRTIVQRAMVASKVDSDYSAARATVGTCLFCSLVGRCPKVAELAIQVGRKYAPLAVPEDVNTVTLADPEQVGAGMKLAQVVAIWAESFRKNATKRALNSEDFVPAGYVLVPSQKTVIKDARKVGEIAKKFLPPEHADKIEALYDITLTPVDKLISTCAPRNFKEKTVEAFREAILAEGAAELGQPYSFLRQSTDKDGDAKVAKE